MRLRACLALLLFFSACAASAPLMRAPDQSRLARLQRAAELPWRDGGQCAVREVSQPWPILVERCFHALDHERLTFHDPTGRCAVASTGAVAMGIGLCVLMAPEIVAGAVIITGVVVVGFALKNALDVYELNRGLPEIEPVPESRVAPDPKPVSQDPLTKGRPKPDPTGQDWLPPTPPDTTERERRSECTPVPVPHRGGHDAHNNCADRVPNNSFPGWDVLVTGKRFDALQMATRTLWEVKTNAIETYNPYVRQAELRKQVEEARHERDLATACGYQFAIGVRSDVHKKMLEALLPGFNIVLMTWC